MAIIKFNLKWIDLLFGKESYDKPVLKELDLIEEGKNE